MEIRDRITDKPARFYRDGRCFRMGAFLPRSHALCLDYLATCLGTYCKCHGQKDADEGSAANSGGARALRMRHFHFPSAKVANM